MCRIWKVEVLGHLGCRKHPKVAWVAKSAKVARFSNKIQDASLNVNFIYMTKFVLV